MSFGHSPPKWSLLDNLPFSTSYVLQYHIQQVCVCDLGVQPGAATVESFTASQFDSTAALHNRYDVSLSMLPHVKIAEYTDLCNRDWL